MSNLTMNQPLLDKMVSNQLRHMKVSRLLNKAGLKLEKDPYGLIIPSFEKDFR